MSVAGELLERVLSRRMPLEVFEGTAHADRQEGLVPVTGHEDEAGVGLWRLGGEQRLQLAVLHGRHHLARRRRVRDVPVVRHRHLTELPLDPFVGLVVEISWRHKVGCPYPYMK